MSSSSYRTVRLQSDSHCNQLPGRRRQQVRAFRHSRRIGHGRESHNNGLSGLPIALTFDGHRLALYGVITGVRHGNPTLIIASSIALVSRCAYLAASSWSTRTRGGCCSSSAPTRDGAERRTSLGESVLHQEADLAPRAELRERQLKVNDHDGNPIEIAAIVVWQVVDTAEAVFEVDDYEHFVKCRASRRCGTSPPATRTTPTTTRRCRCAATPRTIAEHLKKEIQDRLTRAGVEVIEARISHLAYAPEIAAAMLQRQQAGAIIAARQKIVEGAVGMVEMALDSSRAGTSSSSTTSARRPWSATCWSCSAASARRSRSSTPAPSTTSAAVARAQAVPAADRPGVLEALQRWADDDLRSLNGQIEFLLRKVLRDSKRLQGHGGKRPEDSS